MAAGSLTSNHVNYLVWRYLQESGYGESAVRLQRDWREDPQDLPFAHFISTNALVSLVQKGLYYHEIEHSLDQDGQLLSAPADAAAFFGPARRQPLASPNTGDEGVAAGPIELVSDSASPRKHARPAAPDASATLGLDEASLPAPKRHRRSNGTESDHPDPMDVDAAPSHPDTNGTNTNGVLQHPTDQAVPPEQSRPDAQPTPNPHPNAADQALTLTAAKHPQTPVGATVAAPASASSTSSPAPQAHRSSLPPPPPRPTTLGFSVGTQVEKIAELGLEASTTFLDVGRRNVLHCAWSPAQPACLLTAGTEALARIWTIARRLASDEPPALSATPAPHAAPSALTASPTYLPLNPSDHHGDDDRWMVTAVAWSQDGEHVAVGVCDSAAVFDGSVYIWSRSGRLANVFPIGQYPILCLKWSASGTVLLCLCGNVGGTSIILWDLMTADALDSISVDDSLEDAEWVDKSAFIVSGGHTLNVYRFEGRLTLIHNYSSPDSSDLWLVRHDPVTSLLVTCSHSTTISLYDQHQILHSFTAHQDTITALQWQPLQNPRALSDTEPRLFASASLDGDVSLWDGRNPGVCIHRLPLGRANLPVMALSFSPDGFALAAASSHGQILVWNAKDGGAPLAQWSGTAEKKVDDDERMTNGHSGGREEVNESEEHSLSWDADGGKLAYAAGRQVAIIDFRR
ncbi:MAG: hypothetical protein M4579_007221 [Chaenotheca gracillima]|nr:MAG: hypothetical protein M4579_007221 [Chaenotheca gracillima]